MHSAPGRNRTHRLAADLAGGFIRAPAFHKLQAHKNDKTEEVVCSGSLPQLA